MTLVTKYLIPGFILFSLIIIPPSLKAEQRPIVSEIRLGWLIHDVHVISFNRETGSDVNAELLFVPLPFHWVESIGSPRPHLGVSINTAGHTSQVYAGFTWQAQLPNDFFVEAMAGGAAHNGNRRLENEDRKALGTHLLFRLGVSLGYNITEKVNISVMLDHVSNAGIDDANEGLENLGIRIGYKF